MRLLLITIFTFLFIQLNSQNNHWLQTFGSINGDWAYDLKVDHTDNIIVTGEIADSSLIVFKDTTINFNISTGNGYIFKQDSLNNLIWFKQIGGTNGRIAITSLEIDITGNIYIAGSFYDTVDFNPGASPNILIGNGHSADAFLAKLNSSGDLLWSKGFGGNNWDGVTGLLLEDTTNVYLSGFFWGGSDFDPSIDSTIKRSYGYSDGYISKFNSNGAFIFNYRIGWTGHDRIEKVLLNSNHDLLAVGSFTRSVRMNPNSTNQQITSRGDRDIFILRLDTGGNYISVKQIGGTETVAVSNALMDNDTLYLSGNLGNSPTTNRRVDFDPNSRVVNYSSTGTEDSYLAKYDPSDSLIWFYQFGGSWLQRTQTFSINNSKINYSLISQDSLYIHKNNMVIDTIVPDSSTLSTITFIEKNGNYLSSTAFTSNLSMGFYSIEFDSKNNLYTCGIFQGTTDFNPTTSTNYKTPIGQYDAFVMKNFGSLITSNIENKEIESSGFKIYPNPTNGLFEIELENKSNAIVIIRDMSGRLISQQTIPQKTNKIQLELNDVSGIYFVQIILEDGQSFSSKLIKL